MVKFDVETKNMSVKSTPPKKKKMATKIAYFPQLSHHL